MRASDACLAKAASKHWESDLLQCEALGELLSDIPRLATCHRSNDFSKAGPFQISTAYLDFTYSISDYKICYKESCLGFDIIQCQTCQSDVPEEGSGTHPLQQQQHHSTNRLLIPDMHSSPSSPWGSKIGRRSTHQTAKAWLGCLVGLLACLPVPALGYLSRSLNRKRLHR